MNTIFYSPQVIEEPTVEIADFISDIEVDYLVVIEDLTDRKSADIKILRASSAFITGGSNSIGSLTVAPMAMTWSEKIKTN